VTEMDVFVRRICEDPGEDTHRLVFADWLAENGYEGWAYLVRQWGQPTVCPVGMSADVSFYPGPDDDTHYTVKLAEGRKDVRYVVRRGFVHEIRLPVAEFTEEFARDLFRRHPVERVVLTDREPLTSSSGSASWSRGGVGGLAWRWNFLPPQVFDRLSGGEAIGDGASAQFRVYVAPSAGAARDLAVDALSAAGVGWGRSLAGFPALPPPGGAGSPSV